MSWNQWKPKFNYNTDTKYCILLLRIKTLLKNLAKIFQILAPHLVVMAKNVLWISDFSYEKIDWNLSPKFKGIFEHE